VDLIRESVRVALQELIEIEATERIGAAPYERTTDRVTDRNGHRPRMLTTKAGDVELRIPKLREGSMALLYPDSDTGPIAAIDSGEYAPRITSRPTTPRGSVHRVADSRSPAP
jgi:hypothetical protein